MGPDLILNVAWVLTGVLAVAVLFRRTYRRGVAGRAVNICLIIAALFPVISATDDVIRIQHMEGLHASRHSPNESRTTSHKPSPDSLIRLYEAAEAGLTSTTLGLCFVSFFTVLFVVAYTPQSWKAAIHRSGRAPPLFIG